MRAIILTLSLSLFINLSSQVDDMVSLSAGYVNQSFYSLENGEVANVINTDWDIAFMSDAFNSSIIINDNIGTQLYLYSNNSEDWDAVDTTGLDWAPLYNSEFRWEEGAFVQLASEVDPFDYGWGIYNFITHVVTGNRIFILELADGTFKKVIIESLDLGTYTFKYADLDGQNEVVESVSGADYNTKNFWYYSLQNETVIDREPASDSWDITFTRYITEALPGQNYLVTGVLQNIGITASEAREIEVDDAEWTDYSLFEDINVVGSDWKYFNLDQFQYIVEDSLSFFVQDQGGNVWKLIFTDFDGTSTGDIEFTKEMVSATGLDEQGKVDFTVFPNPSLGQMTVILPIEDELVRWSVVDMKGAVVIQDSWNFGFQHEVNLGDLETGIYLLQVEKEDGIGQERIIIQR
ncbi:MAG: T9SS type A sorting domain-containing protein [Flavobacteriales bacterium]|nr:T9SS type A sorting domain-containing protein [Flavobacteriales bacterium]